MRRLVPLILLGILLISCSIFDELQPTNPDHIELFSPDDPEMNAAIQEAQETLPLFIQALQSPKATQTGFAIKAKFPYGDSGAAEHMWVSFLSFAEDRFQGVLESEPVYVQNIQFEDQVSIDLKDVTDWMIIDDNRLLGGFTLFVMRNRMSEDERRQFDASFGYEIPDTPALP